MRGQEVRLLQALRVRDFRLLWSGRLVSLPGTWLLTVAVPAYVLELTGSLLATGLTLAAEYLPLLLLGPLAGVLSDRWDRRRLMIATDLLRAVAVGPMLLVRSRDTVWTIYVALAAESVGSILFRPAAQAHVPVVVGTGPLLSSANALNAGTDATVRLIGAPLGATLMITFAKGCRRCCRPGSDASARGPVCAPRAGAPGARSLPGCVH